MIFRYRNNKGQFATKRKAIIRETYNPKTMKTIKKYYRQIKKPKVPKEQYWQVHAKLSMTKGNRGGSIEMEAYMYVKAKDKETAKDYLRQDINARFSSGEMAFSEATQIKFFANKISKSKVDKTGIIKWRDEFMRRSLKWKQEEITSYL